MRKLALLFAAAILASCTEVELNQYEIDPVNVNTSSGDKTQRKSDLQLISIMYSDVYGKAISQNDLQRLADAYNSFGDKQVIIDRITWGYVNDLQADLPSDSELSADTEKVIRTLYERYLSRTPGEMELWYYQNWINENPDLGVKHLAFVLLTSEEYKYY